MQTENIKDIHWKSQDSTPGSLLFYKVSDEKVFRDRIASAKFNWLIVDRNIDGLPANASVVPEKDWPALQKSHLDRLYPMPDLKLIAITGTNGKTTTTDLVLQLGTLMGMSGLSIGTLGVREIHKTVYDFGLTSPAFIDLRKFLHKYGTGKDFCVMEASSHALAQDRIHGLKFDGAGWLSFTQDHLDYHKDMEEYFEAKALLFNYLKPAAKLFVPMEQTELAAKLLSRSSQVKIAPEIHGDLPIFFQTRFNRNNLEVATAILADVFGPLPSFDVNKIVPPDGRFFIRQFKSNYIVVDSAHTPDALENICKAIQGAFPQHSLKVLFGCGGDRDRKKRPIMGSVVEKYAGKIYLTSDNPRSENPAQIIEDIAVGLKSNKFVKIVDRIEAVKTAFHELTDKEVLLLAGKGHEDYILTNGIKYPYSDIREVEQFIERNSP